MNRHMMCLTLLAGLVGAILASPGKAAEEIPAKTVADAAPAAPAGSPVPETPPFASPNIQPTMADFLTAKPIALKKKICATDPLLRPPFAGQPPDSLKGMAAGIRAVELDIPNRINAVRYLGTVDCVTYPQAQEMLIQTMQEDPSEDVRYEAVMALSLMLSHCGSNGGDCNCNCDMQNTDPGHCALLKCIRNHAKKNPIKDKECKGCKKPAPAMALKKNSKKKDLKCKGCPEDLRYDGCRGCVNEKVLTALSKVAFDKDSTCCWVEPSARIREAAETALGLCPVSAAPAPLPMPTPVLPPEPSPDKPSKPEDIDKSVTTIPPDVPGAPEAPSEKESTDETTPSLNVPEARRTPRAAPVTPAVKQVSQQTTKIPAVAGLHGYCVVNLKNREFVKVDEQFHSVFEGRTYFFSSADAKAKFDVTPAYFAPAFAGIDPVAFLENGAVVEGIFLREFNGRFYLFSTKENWEKFKNAPETYQVPGSSDDIARLE